LGGFKARLQRNKVKENLNESKIQNSVCVCRERERERERYVKLLERITEFGGVRVGVGGES